MELEMNIESFDVNDQDKAGFTWLMRAARENDLEIVTMLLKRGADVNMKANGGQTAIMWAFHWGNGDMIRLFISYGVDFNGCKLDEITAHWIPPEHVYSMMDLIKEFDHSLTVECKKAINAARLKRLFE